MKQILLLCQSQTDTEALADAATALRVQKYEAVWLLFSPAVLVDGKAAAAQHEKDIADLETAISRCAATRDWAGAQGYETQLAAKKLDKVAAVQDAWKTLTEEEKKSAQERVFGRFFAAKPCENMRLEMLRDHYEPSQFIDALNSIRKAWHAPCAPGTFTMDWVSNLAQTQTNITMPPAADPSVTLTSIQQPPSGSDTNTPAAPKAEPKGYTHTPRFKELCRMTDDQLGAIAIKMNMTPKGTKLGIVHQVMKAELAKAT